MLMRLPGMIIERFHHRFIVAVVVLMALIAMPVAMCVDVIGLSVMEPMTQLKRATAPDH